MNNLPVRDHRKYYAMTYILKKKENAIPSRGQEKETDIRDLRADKKRGTLIRDGDDRKEPS